MHALSHCSLEQAQETRQILEVEAIGLAACAAPSRSAALRRRSTPAPLYHGDLEAYISATWCSTNAWWTPRTTRR
jgi:hypothetical protein